MQVFAETAALVPVAARRENVAESDIRPLNSAAVADLTAADAPFVLFRPKRTGETAAMRQVIVTLESLVRNNGGTLRQVWI